MKVLNLYPGIGGNRKLWKDVEVTAVENNKEIAGIYQDFFPDDNVVVEDAHQYLLENYKEFDFIWSSPPCPTHSRIRNNSAVASGQNEVCYPDMKLYEEIILLNNVYNLGKFKGNFIVENVISYYAPLIKPQEIQRHHFWSNFIISKKFLSGDRIGDGNIPYWEKRFGYDLSKFSNIDKRKALRNCVHPKLGLHVFECAFKKKQTTLKVEE